MGATTQIGESEEFLAAHGILVSAWALELKSGRLQVSPRWARAFGVDPRPLDSLDEWLARVDERDRARFRLEFRTYLEGLAPSFRAEYRMKDREGNVRWIRAQGTGGGTGGGPPETVSGLQEDITEQRTLEEALRRSEGRFRALVESCPDAIAVHRYGRIVYANPRMEALLGRGAGTLTGRLLLELVHPDDFQAVIDEVRRLTQGEQPAAPQELRMVLENGQHLHAEVSSSRQEFDGEPAIFAVARDVSERRKMLTKVAQSDRMASLGTLAAGVAHEINNPLAYVSSNLQMLQEALFLLVGRARAMRLAVAEAPATRQPEEVSDELWKLLDPGTFERLLECAQDATEGSARVKAIVADLKHFARRDDEVRGAVDLVSVVERALKITGHESKHRAKVVADLGRVPKVLGEEGRLTQVFINLLVNAAQAIPTGKTGANEIRVSLRTEGGQVHAEVSDTGSGIAPEHRARLFTPFFTTKEPGVGSGLGLAICQRIVADYGGSIEVESEVERGTKFKLRFPALSAEAAFGLTPPTEEPAAPVEHGPRARILVVDDDAGVCRALERDLATEHEVVTAGGGQAALDLLGIDAAFSVVFCDMMMADVTGQDVFEWAREHQPALAPRFVFITGGGTTERAKQFLHRVGNLVLEKPFDLTTIRRVVHTLTLAAAKEPEAPARPERRRAARYRAAEMYGVLARSSEPVRRLEVVDFSSTGLRVTTDGPVATGKGGTLSLVLNRANDSAVVRAEVRVARTVRGRTPHCCFEIANIDPQSLDQYRGWLGAAKALG